MKFVLGCLFVVIGTASGVTAQTKAPTTKPAAPASIGGWQQTLSKSQFDDSPTVVLRLAAEASVRVWLKSVLPVLILRCQERVFQAYIVTSTAAHVQSGDSRTVRLRFDSDAAETQRWSQSTDGDALFAPGPESLLDRLRTAKRLLFEFTPFNASPVVASFSTGGLTNHLSRLTAACPEMTRTQAEKIAQAERSEREAAELQRRLSDPTTPASALIGQTEQQIRWRLGEPL